jgi:hypothetical protein
VKKMLIALAVLAVITPLFAGQAEAVKTKLLQVAWIHNIGGGSGAFSSDTTSAAFTTLLAASVPVTADTTAWVDLGAQDVLFIGAAADTVIYMPLKWCFTGTDSTGALASGDSTVVRIQACNDPNGVITDVFGATTGGSDCVDGLTFSGRQLGLRYWRAIYAHVYTAMPVVRVVRASIRLQQP